MANHQIVHTPKKVEFHSQSEITNSNREKRENKLRTLQEIRKSKGQIAATIEIRLPKS